MYVIKENQIIHENGDFWVLQESPSVYTVMKVSGTHSVSVQSFIAPCIAKMYCDNLAERIAKAGAP